MGADFLCSFFLTNSIFLIVQKTDNVEKPKLEQIPGGNLWQLRLAALLTGEGGRVGLPEGGILLIFRLKIPLLDISSWGI